MPLYSHIVKAKQPWSGQIKQGQVLIIKDTHGQQAVDFLCYDADNTIDRYSATNTVKVQGNIYVGKDTVLYADSGKALMKVLEDTIGRHDTVYGCCCNQTVLKCITHVMVSIPRLLKFQSISVC